MGRSGTGLDYRLSGTADHHGYIEVQSKVGEGTTFTLYFPVTREGIPCPSRRPLERYRGHGESVLVVDDIAEQRDVASVLTQLGYKVHTVSGGGGGRGIFAGEPGGPSGFWT